MAKTAEQKTVTVEDLHGNEVVVPVGLDGVNPVSPNNPALKSVPEGDRERAVAARQAELDFAKGVADAAGAGENAASTNKEDNNPGENVDEKGDSPREGTGSKAAKTAARKPADDK